MGNKGVTAVELLGAVTLAAIVIGSAIPFFLGTIERSRLDAATRQVASEVRKVQSLAVTRSGVFGFHWGGDPNVAGLSNSAYRIERDTTGACGWPTATDTTATNPDVITDWLDISGEYPGIAIQSVTDNNSVVVGGVMYNTIAASVNTCTAVTFPLTITVSNGAGTTRTIQVQSGGSVRIL